MHHWPTGRLLDPDIDFMFDLSVEAVMFDLTPGGVDALPGEGSALMGVENLRPSARFTPF